MDTERPPLRIKLRPDQVTGLKRVAAARGVEPGRLMPEVLRTYRAWRSQAPIGSRSLAADRSSESPGQPGTLGEDFVRDALDWWLALPQNRPV